MSGPGQWDDGAAAREDGQLTHPVASSTQPSNSKPQSRSAGQQQLRRSSRQSLAPCDTCVMRLSAGSEEEGVQIILDISKSEHEGPADVAVRNLEKHGRGCGDLERIWTELQAYLTSTPSPALPCGTLKT